jgi:hypothetical protein
LAILGKSGQKLLPMVGVMGELRQEARDLGSVMSAETAQAAADLADAFNKVVTVATNLAVEVGAALAPALQDAADWLLIVAKDAQEFIKKNQTLVVVVGLVGVGLLALGSALVVVGLGMQAAAVATGALAAVFTVITAHPIILALTLLAAAIAGVVVWMGFLDDESEGAAESMDKAAEKARKLSDEASKAADDATKKQQALIADAQKKQQTVIGSLAALPPPSAAGIPARAVASQVEKDSLKELQDLVDIAREQLRELRSGGGFGVGAS